MRLLTLIAIGTAFLAPPAISLDFTPGHAEQSRDRAKAFIFGADDPDDSRLKFRTIRSCDPRTGLGSLCHYVVRFKNGNAIEFSDPVCVPIACPRRRSTPNAGEDQLVLFEQGRIGVTSYSQIDAEALGLRVVP